MARRFIKRKNRFATKEESGRIAYNQIRVLTGEGESGRSQLKTLRSRGLSITDAEFRKIKRQVDSYRTAGSRLRHSRNTRRLPKSQTPINPYIIRGNYQYIVEIRGVDKDGKKVTRHMTIFSRRPLSKNQIYAKAADATLKTTDEYGFDSLDNVDFAVVEAYQKAA